MPDADQSSTRPDAALVDYYDRRVKEYERIYAVPERQAALARLTAWLQDELRGERVLELACGTGYWTERLAPVAASIHATDLSEASLAAARAKRYPPDRVSFARANAFEAEAAVGSFSAIFVGFLWSHVERVRLEPLLHACQRAIEPGGKIVCCDHTSRDEAGRVISRRDSLGDSYQIRRLDDGAIHEVRKNYFTVEEVLEVVRQAGGLAPRIEVFDWYWALSYRARQR